MGLGVKTKFLQCWDYLVVRRCPFLRSTLWADTTQYGEFFTLQRLAGLPGGKGLVVDVGANDGINCSNSYPFIKRGWNGILVEPNPAVFSSLKSLYRSNPNVDCINLACGAESGELPLYQGTDDRSVYATLSSDDSEWFSATRATNSVLVKVERLEDVLLAAACPTNFEVLSIDTEGFDFFVLQGLNLRHFRPKVIVTEDEKPPFTHSVDKGRLLKEHGYFLHSKFHNNAIWTERKQ